MIRVVNHGARIITAPRYSLNGELLIPRIFPGREITQLPTEEWGLLKTTELIKHYIGSGILSEVGAVQPSIMKMAPKKRQR